MGAARTAATLPLTDPWAWLTDEWITRAARAEAQHQDRREARRDRERRARLTVYRGSTGRDEDDGGESGRTTR